MKVPMRFGLCAALAVFAITGVAASPALAGEAHPIEHTGFETDTFSNPNGIAVEESTADVYVAELGTNTVSKFDANGKPVNFTCGAPCSTYVTGNQITGTPSGSFLFPNEPGDRNPAAIAVDNSTSASDPSAGDLYVMDAGHKVIDKFSPSGVYLSQITGPFSGTAGELLGFGVDASGDVRVDVNPSGTSFGLAAIDVFDSSVANNFVAPLVESGNGGTLPGVSEGGFAVAPSGDSYLLLSCGCLEKFGPHMAELGRVDGGPADVAAAVDPATGHVYVDDQSSVDEWDTGAMNRKTHTNEIEEQGEETPSGALVSSFGSLQLSSSSGQGGIAVNGVSGNIYVSNPADGKVYIFSTVTPAVAAGPAADVTKTSATLQGVVNPRGGPVTSCLFEYGVRAEAENIGNAGYNQSVPCEQTPGQIGFGTSPAPVSANIEGLRPGLLYQFRLNVANADGSSPSSGVFATAGPGFGIKSFQVSFLNQNGTPDTQAGSHPYEMTTNIGFNTRFLRRETNSDSRYILEPDGNFKDLITDLPPGLVGDPNATAKKCTLKQLDSIEGFGGREPVVKGCPAESEVGFLEVEFAGAGYSEDKIVEPVYNMVAPEGVAAQFGVHYISANVFINSGVQAGGDYPVSATVTNASTRVPVLNTRLTIFGVPPYSGEPRTPLLTLPTGCGGPLNSTLSVDSYQEPGHFVEKSEVTRDAAGHAVAMTGCSQLRFPPTITVSPDTTNASTSSGLTVGVHVSQKAALNPEGLAESSLRDTTVALPAGVAINPSGGDGLEACSEGLAGFEIGRGVNHSGFEEFDKAFEAGVLTPMFTPTAIESLQPGLSFCPNGSKIGEVTIHTPLLPNPLKGFVYLASQEANPFGSLLAMYMMVEDPISGSTIKLTGEVQLCAAAGQLIDGMSCQGLGQIITTFKNTPDLPFEELELHFFGGERAPLSTPTRCGTYTTKAVFTPWDGNGPVTAESSFNIEHGPHGSPCPGASLPFSPTVNAGATNIQAGAFSPLTVTLNRKDGEQNLKSLEAKLPPGLSGVLTGVEMCSEPQANEGLCGENSKIGEATIGVGVGNQPFTVTGGKFYLTGPYNGSGACTVGQPGCAPFGITFEVPAKAGPFDLANTKNNHPACDCVVVRGKIELNPLTAAITITTDPPGSPDSIPTSIEGIPLEIQHVNATTTRGDFQFNPTNCAKMSLTATVQLSEGGSSTISTPFQVTNCAALKFEPKFSVSTSGKTSKSKGASLTAKLTYPNVPQGTDADLAKVKVELPKQLPSRLTTLQKACTDKQFEANPAACPSESKIGYATVHTPLIPVPLQGPVIFVSHGGEAFPSLTMVLQGYGITIDLVGTTFISKSGVTSTTFKAVPDQPFSSFELTLPEGKYSALAANGKLCAPTTTKTVKRKVKVRVKGHKKTETRKVKETQPATLAMPVEFVAQNGAEIHETTPITVTGCVKSKPAKKKTKKKAKGGKGGKKKK